MLSSWVKNVYSLRKLSTQNGVLSSPITNSQSPTTNYHVTNHQQLHTRTTSLLTNLSTAIFANLPLLQPSYSHNPQHLLLQERKKIKER